MASDMMLYWTSGSLNSWKPQIVLEEKGLSGYGNKMIEFSKNEHKSSEILALNPRAQIPTFKDGSTIVNESVAICLYLEDKYGKQGNRLMPERVTERALVWQRLFEASNLYNSMIVNIVFYKRNTSQDKLDKDELKKRIDSLREELKVWEGYLTKTGPFLCGHEFTMADVVFFPLIAFGVRLGLKIENFKALNNYYLKLRERSSITKTWPPHWKNPPTDTSFKDV